MDVATHARLAYAQGWAASGGPLTTRVRAGCVAAVDLATAEPDRPGVLEATLHLGHLEGVWAAIFQRRERLHTSTDALIAALWRRMTRRLDVAELVRSVRQNFGITEADADHAARVAAAASAALTTLRGLVGDEDWSKLRRAVRDAIAAGQAEGAADAVGLALDQIGHVGIDFSIAFNDAYRALEDVERLWTDADAWLADLIGDAATELGGVLARSARDGDSYEDMLTAAQDTLGEESRTVAAATDLLTSRAMSRGALDLYASAGVDQVDFVTAGDQRVCQTPCQAAEDRSPYPLSAAPSPGLHPRCRCVVAATMRLPDALLAAYQPAEV